MKDLTRTNTVLQLTIKKRDNYEILRNLSHKFVLFKNMSLSELEELLLKISYKDENRLSAENAFNTLYKHYSPFLSSVIKSALKEMGIYNEELYNIVMNNVFYKIFENPFSFKIPVTATNDKCFKGWLSKVAKNELLTQKMVFYSKEDKLNTISDIEYFRSSEIKDDTYESSNTKMLKQALNTLK